MKKHLKWLIPLLMVTTLAIVFLTYSENYYHADETVPDSLESDINVTVTKTDYGYFFDGPSDSDALVFYPGAKVDETAYAPMLHLLAERGIDVCLVKMPVHLAIFGANKASSVIELYDYKNWYIGGHSLGGAMAANFAANHGAEFVGVILFAAYPTKQLNSNLREISIYGSEDGVLNMDNIEHGKAYAPDEYLEYKIDGGNHAQFGNYGAQKGDGTATISSEEQQELSVDYIIRNAI